MPYNGPSLPVQKRVYILCLKSGLNSNTITKCQRTIDKSISPKLTEIVQFLCVAVQVILSYFRTSRSLYRQKNRGLHELPHKEIVNS